ncbi:hypothetical protein [Frankia sp. R82]|uniref:hypothetical protein n=1 Tax=Frankia sp. R82 TaxID=2950553 RepID=UPI0020444328|nr:hypothetical protein [Frankia sp. R82]MCM3882070.1 hypothetical protein [Frankia sp. R82]
MVGWPDEIETGLPDLSNVGLATLDTLSNAALARAVLRVERDAENPATPAAGFMSRIAPELS